MGLDWCLKNQVREGCAKRAEEISAKLEALDEKFDKVKEPTEEQTDKYRAERRELDDQMAECVITPPQAIGAPRVGVDERATKWFHDQVWLPSHERALSNEGNSNPYFVKFWSRSFDECLKDEHGKHVIELAEGYDKSTCTGMMASPTSFRGKVVGYCEAVPEELRDEAYHDHEAKDAANYGERLLKAACDWLRGRNKALAKKTDEEILARYDELRAKGRALAKEDPPKGPFEGSAKEEEFYEGLRKADKDIMEAWPAFDGARWLVFWGNKNFGFHAWY